MKRSFWSFALIICLALIPVGSATASDWTLMHYEQGTSTAPSGYLNGISIIDEDNVFFSGLDMIYTTGLIPLPETNELVFFSTDGGTNLITAYSLPVTINLGSPDFGNSMIMVNDIHFTSTTDGFLVGVFASGNFAQAISSTRGWVAKTTDGGQTWTDCNLNPEPVSGILYNEMRGIAFLDNTGYVASDAKHIYRTDDGGANWAGLSNVPGTSDKLTDIAIIDQSNVFIAGWNDYVDYYYDDKGGETKGQEDILYASDGILAKTGDGGTSWQKLMEESEAGFTSLVFTDADHGWMTTSGYDDWDEAASSSLLYTTDGGVNWTEATMPEIDGEGGIGDVYIVTGVSMTTSETGWAIGFHIYTDQSLVFYTDDGGVNWVFDDYYGTGQLYDINMLDNRTGFIVGAEMTVLRYYNNTNEAPVANAGVDRSVNPGATVTLDGTASYDPDGDDITYNWTQVSGQDIAFDDATSATPTFTTYNTDESYVIQLVVNDGLTDSEPDTMTVTAGAPVDDDDDDSSDDDDDDSGSDNDDSGDDDDDDSGGCGC